MSRVRTLFALIVPSALAGGLLFASAFSRADSASWSADGSPWDGRVLVAQAEPPAPPRHAPPPSPPAPPSPSSPPSPPSPPSPHSRPGRGFSFSYHGGKIEIEGVAELVQESLEKALQTLDHLPDVPSDTRMRLRGRIQGMRNQLNARLGRLKSLDLDRLGPELERMGDEIERQMEGLDEELSQLGDKLGKNFAKKFGKDFAKNFGPGIPSVTPGKSHDSSDDADDDDDDDDDDHATAMVRPTPTPTPTPDAADPDLGPAIAALKGLALDAGQRAELVRLRADSDQKITTAKRDLERMSSRLHDTLRDSDAKEADVAQQIEAISTKEAAIRKARILTWLKVRHMLHPDQRKAVEEAIQNH